MSVTIKDNITSTLQSIEKKLASIPKEAYTEFLNETPVRSGNARRNTKLEGTKIKARYAYAGKLDQGYSKQSPEGMSKPTEDFIKKRLAQILKGK
jgi:hypothetical protein